MKRTFKLNGEVSIEANDMLVAYCKKHERSKGFLLEKMIRKFCSAPDAGGDAQGQTEQQKSIAEYVKPKAPAKRFVPPSQDEVFYYMQEKGTTSDNEAQKFCDFYESNGWKVGKNKMKCWKAAARNWLKGNGNGHQNKATNAKANIKESSHERIKRENDIKYRGSNECGLGVGEANGDMGRAMDKGQRVETVIGLDNEPFIDY